MNPIKTVKLILAALLMLCLLDMPYGFYQLVRYLSLIGFSFLAYQASEADSKNEMFIYIALAILFQPILKISLGRELWNIVDVIVSIGLVASIFKTKSE